MSFSFTSFVRLLVLLAVGATMTAVGLSRLAPSRPNSRSVKSVKYSNINEFFLNNVTDRTPVWLDSETGRMARYPLEDGDILESASCSPWVDEKNQLQVIGRWTTRIKDGPMSVSKDFGLARYSFPSGQVLDHVSTEIVPVSPPCWYPGTQARILFAAGDGMLYHFAFEPEPWVKAENPEAGRDIRPIPLTWRCSKPGNGKLFLSDVTWPDDPRMGGCLVVSIRELPSAKDRTRAYNRTSLWWVKLNYAGTEIVDLGRLLVAGDNESDDKEIDYRTPSVGSLPDGRMALAYLRQRLGKIGWEARIVPLELDDRHLPRADETAGVVLSSICEPAQPTFSRDGAYLNVIVGPDSERSHVERLSLKGLFGPAR